MREFLRLGVLLILILNPVFGFGQSGIFQSYLILNKNNAGNVYYDLQAATVNPDFNVPNALGSFDCNSTLILNGAQNKTYKCGTDNITDGWLQYRVYEQGTTPPAFTSLQILYMSDDGTAYFCGNTSNDQTWQTNAANVNILAGLSVNTTYVFEVYTLANFTYTSGSGTHYANNDPDGGGPTPPNNFSTTFTIDDTTAPVPDNAVLSDVTAQCQVTSLTAPTGTDDCGGVVTVSHNATLPITTQGTTVVTWTYDDGNGNTSTQTQNVVIDDTTDPATPTLSTITGQCSATATAPTTTDNCSGTITGTTSDPLTYNTQGTFTINWTFNDGNGNSITVPQTVIVDDTTDPATPTLATITGQCSATATAPTTTDNCSGTITGTTSDPLTYNTQGTFTINWTFNDGNGNSITVPQTVIVDDTTDPATPTLSTITGQCSATATAPTTTDNCSGTITGTTSDPLTYNTQGTFTINWTFNDGNGNSIIVPQTVIVDDTTDPATPTLSTITGQCSATATAPTTTDNCSGTITGTTSDPLTYNTQGTFTINWTFNDGNGNSITVPQTVIVDDTTDPATPTLSTITGQCSATATAPTTTDNCSGTITGTTSDPLSYNTQGTFTINWTFNDGNGNSITVPQTVIVDDTTDPATPTLSTITGQCSATATAPTTTDNCSGTITGTTSDPLTYNTQGTFTINWTFNDGNGNSITVPQTVIVDDTTDPATPTLSTITGQCSATATAPTTTDNCSGTITGTTSDPLTYNTQGTFTINWTFNDGNGNSITVPQTVIVDDTTDPATPTLATITGQCSATATAPTTTDNCSGTITGTTSDPLTYNTQGTFTINWTFNDGNGNSITVPQTVIVDDTTDPATPTLSTITGQCSATATAPTTTDNCSGTITGTTSDPLTYNTQGTFTINWTFNDGNGNSITVPQTVIVDDTTDPATPTLSTITGQCSATATAPTTTDNCSGTITGTTSDPLTYNTQGTFTINWTFNDGNGNSIIVPQTVIVDDTTDPATPTLSTITGQCSATATAPTTTDNCSGTITGTTSDPLTYNTQGTFTINWTFNDGNGNSITVPQTVIVDDTTDPATPTLSTITGQCSATATAPTTTDNCSGTITGTTSDPLIYNTQGTFTINWTFNDGNGNSITVPQTVIVDDTTDPATPSLAVVTGQCSATLTAPTTTDNCSGTITGTTSDPLTYNTQGSFAVTWNFDDGNGNTINVVQNVVINDTTAPVAICQDITVQLSDANGTATITPAQVDNGSTDNCGVVNLSLSQSTFNCNDIGSHVIVLTVDDGNGNTDTCLANVTVVSPNISGGTALGYLNNTETIADQDDLVEVTACPDEAMNATFNLYGFTGTVLSWELSNDGGLNWSTVGNTTTSFSLTNILETTLVRAVIGIGACKARSTIVRVNVIPPDVPPTIVGQDTFAICLGADITVVAESEYANNPQLNEGGEFNQGNLPGWEVEGLDGITNWNASGSNTVPTGWRGISSGNGDNSSNITAGVRYKNQGGNKFAITYGNFGTPSYTTLETPIFNTLGLSTASLDFQSAYYLQAGASGSVEISVDGGATYTTTLMSFSGAGNSGGFVNAGNGPNNVPTIQLQDPGNSVSLDLSNYIGLTNLRIRFAFTSTAGSSWAIDGITIPQDPVDEILEWTDGTGTVVTVGSTTTITPVTPGQQTYGVTSLINGCRSDGDEGTEFITVSASLAYAGKNIVPITGECGQDTVELNAYDNTLTASQNIINGAYDNNYISGTYPGTGEAGVWAVVSTPSACGSSYSFSDLGNPRATFSGDPGLYVLSWTVAGCTSTVEVTLDSCQSLDFDGTNDYVDFKDNYDLSGQFSLEAWVKPNAVSGTQVIYSKRDANNLNNGYDLRLTGNTLSFNWNNGQSIQSSYAMSTNRWYHVAVTFDNSNYRLYIDGISVANAVSGSTPNANARLALLGAMDQTGNPPNRPVNYFNGWIDELRIWNTAISADQLRMMMNQEIEDNAGVRGTIVPLTVPGLSWSNLDGYYRMQVNCGFLTANKGVRGRLRNINSIQQETAPIPYTSRVDGQNWATDNTWTHFTVWDAPNSIGVDGSTAIDWNIVQISHNINSGNKDITVLGLISDAANKTLDIKDPGTAQDETNNGQSLRITHYLKLDGDIDLFGESQLLQDEGSILDVTSSGRLERDQQGTTNLYNYNYWSSPVSPSNITSNNNPYSVASVLHDGSNSANPQTLQWTSAHDANGSTNPITMSRRWLYAYENYPEDTYAAWRDLNENDAIATGLSFTMKGSGVGDPINDVQNYVFVGKPNNGTITTPVTVGNQALIGNPYPSAMDANEFILDNIPGPTGSSDATDGTLYFWEHYTSNFTHILEDYEGGYATYNLTGGNPAVSPPLVSGQGTPTKLPGRYIPVSQGFFVTASNVGGNIQFKNSQRAFVREATGTSVFMRSSNPNVSESQGDPNAEVKRVRLKFTTPEGAIRPLLLGFVEDGYATDDFDYGYDAENADAEFPNDLFWRIGDKNYTTQGVGAFEPTSQYPLGLFLSTTGMVEIKLSALENFEEDVTVYIYDALLDTYYNINEDNFQISLDPDNYLDRFYVTFINQDSLSVIDFEADQNIVSFLNTTQEIFVKTSNTSDVKSIQLVNILGQVVQTWNNAQNYVTNNAIRIPVNSIADGTYIITVKTSNGLINKKVLVKK